MRDTIERKPLFVIAAEVSAELNRGVKIAKQLQLVASNARALALRAGESAAGFRPVTDSIDELVLLTFHSSNTINRQAQQLSQIATERTRAQFVLKQLNRVEQSSKEAIFLSSLNQAKQRANEDYQQLNTLFTLKAKSLKEALQELYDQLRIAQIISTMLSVEASVEASKVDERYRIQLNAIADSVTEFSDTIRHHVSLSLKLFSLFL
ncbi:chemotaxis protein [Vibrio vulnificus]|uniref:chemotaxis protein n=1 Tax=Vibrio vulnificus TaxID=672 RepID=UPI001CDB6FCC|nr:chemotaxis protein [Vibrio vulnificus]MCA3979964.1 chemotaxis protein [Vibrio vulnificus]MCA4006709.1 chemotaxis protein [Vibrio vulnificus]